MPTPSRHFAAILVVKSACHGDLIEHYQILQCVFSSGQGVPTVKCLVPLPLRGLGPLAKATCQKLCAGCACTFNVALDPRCARKTACEASLMSRRPAMPFSPKNLQTSTGKRKTGAMGRSLPMWL